MTTLIRPSEQVTAIYNSLTDRQRELISLEDSNEIYEILKSICENLVCKNQNGENNINFENLNDVVRNFIIVITRIRMNAIISKHDKIGAYFVGRSTRTRNLINEMIYRNGFKNYDRFEDDLLDVRSHYHKNIIVSTILSMRLHCKPADENVIFPHEYSNLRMAIRQLSLFFNKIKKKTT